MKQIVVFLLLICSCLQVNAEIVTGKVSSKGVVWAFDAESGALTIDADDGTSLATEGAYEAELVRKLIIKEGIGDLGKSLGGTGAGFVNLSELVIEDSDNPIKFPYTTFYNYYNYYKFGNYFIDSQLKKLHLGRSIVVPKGYRFYSNGLFAGKPIEEVYISDNVRYFPDGMFWSCQQLKKVRLSENMESIPYGTFSDCIELNHKIVFPQKCKTIGERAFYGDQGITEIDLMNVETIGESAFEGCPISKLVIPRSVSQIEENALPNTINDLYIEDGSKKLIGNFRDMPLSFVHVGRNVNGRGNTDNYYQLHPTPCFNEKTLKSFEIGDSVSKIGAWTFWKCKYLKEIVIPKNVTEIECLAFYGCDSVESIVFESGSSVLTIRPEYSVSGDSYQAIEKNKLRPFYFMNKLRSLFLGRDINSNVYGLESPFCSKEELSSVTISDSVTSLINAGFNDCPALTKLIIPSSVETLGSFTNSGLTDLVFEDGTKSIVGKNDIFNGTKIKNLYIGRDLVNCSFSNVSATLTSVAFGDNVTMIAGGLLNGCSNIVGEWKLPRCLKTIGRSAFHGCKNIKGTLIIPGTVESIDGSAFGDCTGINRVVFQDGEADIKAGGSFLGATEIEYVYVGRNLSNGYVFSGKKKIKEIEIAKHVSYLGVDLFKDCTSLFSTKVHWDYPLEDGYVFDTSFKNAAEYSDLYVPKGTKRIYSRKFVWKDFYDIIEYDEEPTYSVTVSEGCCSSEGNVLLKGLNENGNIEKGKDLTVEIKKQDGYVISKVIINDEDVTDKLKDDKYTIKKVDKDIDINVEYQERLGGFIVKFIDWDGKVLKTEEVESGKAATAPKNPKRTGYSFTGWDKTFTSVKADMTVTALYSAAKYTVKFVDWDGKTLKTEEVEHGKAATAPANPTRTGYTFTGWDKTFTSVKADMTVTAQYSAAKYTVMFVDWDGKTLKTQEVEHGKAATAPTNPTRTGYTFTGWDKTFTSVKADMTVTALYSAAKYTVKFVDWDGKTLKTEEVEHGKAATAPTNPTRTGYTFTGWDKTFASVKADMTVTAQYSAAKYTVKFVDWDGKTLKTEEVEHGKAATAPTNPTRTGYTFTGWDKTFASVKADMTVTAQYAAAKYTVKFVDWDGKTLKTQEVEHGNAATAPTNPTRTGYTFTGWDKTIASVKADMTVTAQYSAAKYTVKFVDWDGKTLKTEEVEHGKAATAPTNPTRTGYSFTGWDKTFTSVKADITVTAQYSAAKYTVKFVDWDGKTLKTEEVEHGKAATAPTNPTRTGYTFTGWDKTFTSVKADITVTAQYSAAKYTVKFVDWDGKTLKTQEVVYGKAATAPTSPTRTGYSFTGWDKTFTSVKADMTVTAQYSAAKYTVKFIDWDGKTLKTQEVEHGKAATAPTNPTRTGYKFVGWIGDYGNVVSDVTVTAKYEKKGTTTEDKDGVDLGLPSGTIWAKTNLGAKNEKDAGDFFAWGEKDNRESFSWENYGLGEGTWDKMTKYTGKDGKKKLAAEDDAAKVRTKNVWRMPTKAEMEELIEKCTWKLEGEGFRVTGPNGKSIYLPLGGLYMESREEEGTKGMYWGADIWEGSEWMSVSMYLSNERSKGQTHWTHRRMGLMIRPVK